MGNYTLKYAKIDTADEYTLISSDDICIINTVKSFFMNSLYDNGKSTGCKYDFKLCTETKGTNLLSKRPTPDGSVDSALVQTLLEDIILPLICTEIFVDFASKHEWLNVNELNRKYLIDDAYKEANVSMISFSMFNNSIRSYFNIKTKISDELRKFIETIYPDPNIYITAIEKFIKYLQTHQSLGLPSF